MAESLEPIKIESLPYNLLILQIRNALSEDALDAKPAIRIIDYKNDN